MFNTTLFNRNAFNRSVSSSSISLTLIGNSELKMKMVIRIPININHISGTSNMTCTIIMQQHMQSIITGAGAVDNNLVLLKLDIPSIKLSGVGKIVSDTNVRTPFRAFLTGDSVMHIDNRIYLSHHMNCNIIGEGQFRAPFVMRNYISSVDFLGSSTLQGNANMLLPLIVEPQGVGEFELRRLGALNESILELMGINLLPGDTITIDTDLLQVLIGAIEDVSFVTNDSVFFELNPGENEIRISTDTNNKLGVTAIWQNRWL